MEQVWVKQNKQNKMAFFSVQKITQEKLCCNIVSCQIQIRHKFLLLLCLIRLLTMITELQKESHAGESKG